MNLRKLFIKGKQPAYSDLFVPMNKFATYILASLLYTLVVVIGILPDMISESQVKFLLKKQIHLLDLDLSLWSIKNKLFAKEFL